MEWNKNETTAILRCSENETVFENQDLLENMFFPNQACLKGSYLFCAKKGLVKYSGKCLGSRVPRLIPRISNYSASFELRFPCLLLLCFALLLDCFQLALAGV